MVPLVYINSEERTIFECMEILQRMQVPEEFIDKYIKNMEFIDSVHVQRQASTEEHYNDIITTLTMCKKKHKELEWKEIMEMVMEEVKESKRRFKKVKETREKIKALEEEQQREIEYNIHAIEKRLFKIE